MLLNRTSLSTIAHKSIVVPEEELFLLPEKILQFGTGVLLRGLCDYYVDKANREGKFNGRIVVVKSTSPNTSEFSDQDNLYTICVRGKSNGNLVSENIISSSISRVVSAVTQWREILDLAADPNINIIISNTTEVGLQLVLESVFTQPPSSYPAKLVALLHERFTRINDIIKARIIIVPTELIPGNGDKLRDMCIEISRFNNLDAAFITYLQQYVTFCNSLVDRIVTKDPGEKVMATLKNELGYEDKLLTMCEDYHLWAIEGDEYVRSILRFADGNTEGAFIKPDITVYRALKLHLLNGTHTLSAPLAYLAGFNTVREAMQDKLFRSYVENLMLHDISDQMPVEISKPAREAFGRKVLDRFSNPFLEHQWLNITFQQSMKMRTRNLPILLQCQRMNFTPHVMAKGFAAYLLFMKAVKLEDGKYFGRRNEELYVINDDKAGYFYNLWQNVTDIKHLVKQVLANNDLWEHDLSTFAAFADAVEYELVHLLSDGAAASINKNS